MASAQGKEKPAAIKFQKSYFDVLGLCCSSEVPLIENILKPLEGVKDVSVIVPSRTVIVVHDSLLISQLQIVKALNQARLEANVRVYGAGDIYKKTWPSPYAIGSGVLLVLSFLKYAYRPLGWLALGAVAVGIFPVALNVLRLFGISGFMTSTFLLSLPVVEPKIFTRRHVDFSQKKTKLPLEHTGILTRKQRTIIPQPSQKCPK